MGRSTLVAGEVLVAGACTVSPDWRHTPGTANQRSGHQPYLTAGHQRREVPRADARHERKILNQHDMLPTARPSLEWQTALSSLQTTDTEMAVGAQSTNCLSGGLTSMAYWKRNDRCGPRCARMQQTERRPHIGKSFELSKNGHDLVRALLAEDGRRECAKPSTRQVSVGIRWTRAFKHHMLAGSSTIGLKSRRPAGRITHIPGRTLAVSAS